jgi:hypothetical protein
MFVCFTFASLVINLIYLKHPVYYINYSRSETCSRICPNEIDLCAVAIMEAITLLTSFILLISLHFHYVFMLIC